jgi:hypothetical protein
MIASQFPREQERIWSGSPNFESEKNQNDASKSLHLVLPFWREQPREEGMGAPWFERSPLHRQLRSRDVARAG